VDAQPPGRYLPVLHARHRRHRSAGRGLDRVRQPAGTLVDGHRSAFPRAGCHQTRGRIAPKGSLRLRPADGWLTRRRSSKRFAAGRRYCRQLGYQPDTNNQHVRY
jgi:hypothetical protein